MTATRSLLDTGETGRDALQLVLASILEGQSGAGSLRILTGGQAPAWSGPPLFRRL